MSVAVTRAMPIRARRATLFRVGGWVMAVLALTVMGGLPGLLAPWVFLGEWPGHQFPEVHRWHDAQWGAMMAVLVAGALILLLRRPAERPLLMQILVVATGALVLLNAPFDALILLGLALGVFAPMVLMAALYPERPALLTVRVPAGQSLNWPLVLVSLLTGALLARPAWRWYDVQLLRAADEHSKFQHWTITAVLAVVLVAAGLLAATNRPGSRALGLIAGAALVYLGVAAIAVPDHAGSWGVNGGALAIVAGFGYSGTTLLARSCRLARPAAPARR